MKALKLFLLILCLTLTLCGCNNTAESGEAVSDETSSEQPEHQGQTETLLWKEVSKNASGVITSTTEYAYDSQGRKATVTTVHETGTTVTGYKYDENGFLVDEQIKTKGGSFIFHCIYENDANGNVLKETTVDKNGNVLTETVRIYDENGRIQQTAVDGKITINYSYEADGSYTETHIYLGGYFKYDKNGNVITYKDDNSETTYNYEHSLLTEMISVYSDKVYKNVYEYRNGLISRQTDYENDQIIRIYSYKYDENMRLIEDSVQNSIGVVSRTTYYEYKEFEIEKQ